jgi:hypothetical protein
MKSCTSKLKDSAFKKKEDIDSLIVEMNEEDLSPSKEIVTVDNSQKSLVPDNFYRGQLFPMIENYLPASIQLTEVEKVELTKGVTRKLTGLNCSVPIRCYGETCPFKSSCALYAMGKAPEGLDCPIEAMVMDLYTKRYLDEFRVESENFSEVTTMTMLAATHIMEMRAFAALGQDESPNAEGRGGSPDGLIRNVVGFNNDDEPILQIQEHPAYNIIERAWRWRTKLLESLGATRKDKLKRQDEVLDNLTNSLSRNSAEIKSAIERVSQDIEIPT